MKIRRTRTLRGGRYERATYAAVFNVVVGRPASVVYTGADLAREAVIRIRRVKPGLLRRRRYEVEMAAGDELIVRRTSAPVTLIDRDMGTGDAWSLVHAANEAWEKGDHGWVSLDG